MSSQPLPNELSSRPTSGESASFQPTSCQHSHHHHQHQHQHQPQPQPQPQPQQSGGGQTVGATSSGGAVLQCPCAHHYHHMHHHPHPGVIQPPPSHLNHHYHYPHLQGVVQHPQQQQCHQQVPPPSTSGAAIIAPSSRCMSTSSHSQSQEDVERQISGETHVSVTVHQQAHQYQALDLPGDDTCDCNQSGQEQSGRSSRLVSADEAIPSGSEDSNVRKCLHRSNKLNLDDQPAARNSSSHHKNVVHMKSPKSSVDERNYSSRIEVYSDGTDSGVKITDGATSEEDQGPPLPPRPPPRPRTAPANESSKPPHSSGVRKYVVWCLICGGTSCLLGIMFLGVYFLLRSYTSTVGYFETVPTFVPATLLMLTGLCIMSLARRRNRYSYLIKLSGACGLASALTCALVTVTTTVLHMSRLQALKECEYTLKTRTCTCYSVMIESQVEGVDEGVRFVFDSTADCGVVHGALYSCLRAVFGLSVAGVLVAVFSCMLVYQLLSHERKKMYWEQLELRCRSLYASQQGPGPGGPGGPSIIGTPRGNSCRCCEQCHSHRNAMPTTYPWDGDSRFWAPGQPGNFYSPNPGGDEMAGQNRNMNQPNSRGRSAGWSWPRMPWQRNESNRFRPTPSSPDSQYGFSNTPAGQDPATISSGQGYSVIGSVPFGVWGPPPPYSDPNSPARRGRYQYIHPNQCQPMIDHQMPITQQNVTNMECHQHSSSTDSHSMEPFCPQQTRNVIKRQSGFKTKENYENTPSDSDGPRDRFSNTLPVRKTKKRVEIGAKSIGPNSQSSNRVNVQNVFTPLRPDSGEHEYHEPGNSTCDQNPNTSNQSCHQKMKRIKTGVENNGFQNVEGGSIHDVENGGRLGEPTESEVYFADVSSCCNISVKNDNYYDDANQRPRTNSNNNSKQDKEDNSKFNKDETEDYLAQRFGKREASIRSRLPFPQMIPEDYEKPAVNLPIVAPRPSLMHKDISRQSMCSVDSGEKTDFTDLSPATPCTNFAPNHFNGANYSNSTSNNQSQDFNETNSTNFVASFPFSSNEQSQEAHRRSTKNIQDVFLAPDAQYEIIKDSAQFESMPLTLNYDQELSYNKSSHFHKPKSPKNLNLTPIKRQNLGTNITSIIQNLGGSDVGLLYPDSRRDSEHDGPSDKQHRDQQSQQSQQQQPLTAQSDNEWSDHSDRRL